jgi:hypothetical protein
MAELNYQTPIPAFTEDPYSTTDEIMASMKGYTQRGVTFASGNGVIYGGRVVGRITASKKWAPYDDADNTGLEVARGILRHTIDTTDGDVLGNVVIMGVVKNSKVSGEDANAITDLNARVDTILDIFVF